MTEFAVGQYVEVLVQFQTESGADIDAGTRAVVRIIDPTRPLADIYLVEFLRNERTTGERGWLRGIDVLAA